MTWIMNFILPRGTLVTGLLSRLLKSKTVIGGGYEFSVIDDIGVEPFELVGRLIGRIHRALNRKHIYWDETTGNWQVTDDDIVRGKIDSDRDGPDYERRPLLVIDGKEISWGEFGRMLITYEGFSFKLEIFGSSDEIL